MTAHISEELPRLLSGEATREAVLSSAEHLRSCVDCQHELISAVVAHASLTSARRFAPELMSGPFAREAGPDDDAEADVSTDVSADVSADVSTVPSAERNETDRRELPDLSSVFARAREEAAAPRRHTGGRRTMRARYLMGAAAAVVALGAGSAIYVATSDSGPSTNQATRTVNLDAFDKGGAPAKATIGKAGEISIDASSLPKLAGKRYEVWLTDDARTKMQPVGWLTPKGTAAMTVPDDLLSHYQDIEISVQKVDSASYDYSGTSVLRGSLD
jgi:hypothetical protein